MVASAKIRAVGGAIVGPGVYRSPAGHHEIRDGKVG